MKIKAFPIYNVKKEEEEEGERFITSNSSTTATTKILVISINILHLNVRNNMKWKVQIQDSINIFFKKEIIIIKLRRAYMYVLQSQERSAVKWVIKWHNSVWHNSFRFFMRNCLSDHEKKRKKNKIETGNVAHWNGMDDH